MKKGKPLLTDEDMKPENIKANITIRMSSDILDGFRKLAKELGIGYQTLMQIKLKEALAEESATKSREERLEQRIANLERLIGRGAPALRNPAKSYSTSKRGTVKKARTR